MQTRADIDPGQASAAMDKAQEQARTKDLAVTDARETFEELERRLNEAEDETLQAQLAEQHEQAERALEFAEQEFEEAMDEVGRVQDFWFEELVTEEDF